MLSSPILKRDGAALALIFAVILILHLPFLNLPYFWDEAGHYIPAARDFMLSGDLIPHSTISNAHPPLPMMYLALFWSIFGYSPLGTRIAILLVATFGLLQVLRIGEELANRQVAVAATILAAIYPVYFAQSSLAHADLSAAALGLWGLRLYFEDRIPMSVFAFALAALAKETAIVIPATLGAVEILNWIRDRSRTQVARRVLMLALPAIPLALWFGYHYSRTGYIFGNPEFFRYNVGETLVPLRFLLAALRRLWQVSGYMNLWVLTVLMMAAMLLRPVVEGDSPRPRIAIPAQLIILALILSHVMMHSIIGGAVLARYMMPVVPLVILIAVSTLWRRVRQWRWAVAFVGLTFVIGWFVPPITAYAPEDNLTYASYIRLHQNAARYVEAHYPHARVLTAWPASDELTHPYLGYVKDPLAVVSLQNFSLEQMRLAQQNSDYDVALLFSTKVPRPRLPWEAWEQANQKFFDLHEDVPPEFAAMWLGGHIVMKESQNGEWVAVVEFPSAHDAKLTIPPPASAPDGKHSQTSSP